MLKPLLCLALILPGATLARDIAGQFDYYVLSLSWSPSWCRQTGDAREALQCAQGRREDFVLHGLWPQYEQGWPQDCRSSERDPSRRESQAMADIMGGTDGKGGGGLAWYQWQKHGRCSGLSVHRYFETMRDAWDSITIPPVFDGLNRDVSLPPAVVEDAFIEANPALTRNAITVTCRDGALQEVRICLTKALEPRDCAPDTRRDCQRHSILMEKTR